jgi:hypothetical protein
MPLLGTRCLLALLYSHATGQLSRRLEDDGGVPQMQYVGAGACSIGTAWRYGKCPHWPDASAALLADHPPMRYGGEQERRRKHGICD